LKTDPKEDENTVDAGIPSSAFEEALLAVEKIRSEARAAAKAAPPTPVVAPAVAAPAATPAPREKVERTPDLEAELATLSRILEKEISVEKDAGAFKSAAGKAASAPETKVDDAALKEKEQQIEELTKRVNSIQEETEKFRSRVTKEAESVKRFGNENLLLKLLPILDNLERAIEHADSTEEKAAMVQGVRLVHKQLGAALVAAGLTPIEAKGQVFDPNFHEALATVETDEVGPNVVISEYLKGYKLFDRLLRPARVVVSQRANNHAPAAPAAPANAAEATAPPPAKAAETDSPPPAKAGNDNS
jgi:molecular chaperone GrpE